MLKRILSVTSNNLGTVLLRELRNPNKTINNGMLLIGENRLKFKSIGVKLKDTLPFGVESFSFNDGNEVLAVFGRMLCNENKELIVVSSDIIDEIEIKNIKLSNNIELRLMYT